MKQFVHDWIHLTQGEMFLKYWHLWLLMVLIVLLVLVVIVWWHDNIFNQHRSKSERTTKQSHVRIEFEDIRDVPKVWVDGELIEELINLKVLWNTNTQTENYKEFDVYYYDLTGERPMRRGFREGTPR